MYKFVGQEHPLPSLILKSSEYYKYPCLHESSMHSMEYKYFDVRENMQGFLHVQDMAGEYNVKPQLVVGYSAAISQHAPGFKILAVDRSVDSAVLNANICFLLERIYAHTQDFVFCNYARFFKVVDKTTKETAWFREEEEDINNLADLREIVGSNKDIFYCEGFGLEFNDSLLVFQDKHTLLEYLIKKVPTL